MCLSCSACLISKASDTVFLSVSRVIFGFLVMSSRATLRQEKTKQSAKHFPRGTTISAVTEAIQFSLIKCMIT